MISAIATGSLTDMHAFHATCLHEPGSRCHQLDSAEDKRCVRLPRNEGLWQLP